MNCSSRALGAFLALAVLAAAAAPADADTVGADEYRARLLSARASLAAGPAGVERARTILGLTTAVRLGDGTVAVDDSRLAARLGASPAQLGAARADIDARVAILDRVARPPHDAARADAALRALVTQDAAAAVAGSFTQVIVALVRRWLDAIGRPDPFVLVGAQILVGLALAATLVVIVARGVRERLRVEATLPELRAGGRAADPAVYRHGAEDAARRGDPRVAIHLWYRYAFAALDAREAFAYDPTLTDRELLARAAAVPHVDALGELVGLHERIWFGLRDPRADEATHAGALARRVAA